MSGHLNDLKVEGTQEGRYPSNSSKGLHQERNMGQNQKDLVQGHGDVQGHMTDHG